MLFLESKRNLQYCERYKAKGKGKLILWYQGIIWKQLQSILSIDRVLFYDNTGNDLEFLSMEINFFMIFVKENNSVLWANSFRVILKIETGVFDIWFSNCVFYCERRLLFVDGIVFNSIGCEHWCKNVDDSISFITWITLFICSTLIDSDKC